MGGEASFVNHCVAQMLLRMKNITTIRPSELAEMMDIHRSSAWRLLDNLSWRREQEHDGSIYHYEGRDKVFAGTVVGMARKKLARLLGVPKEEIMEVPV